MKSHLHEASKLISRHIDGVMTDDEESRLTVLMREDSCVVRLYVHLMKLHGELTWGVADCSPDVTPAADDQRPVAANSDAHVAAQVSRFGPRRNVGSSQSLRRVRNLTGRWLIPTSVILMTMMALGLNWLYQTQVNKTTQLQGETGGSSESAGVADNTTEAEEETGDFPPLRLDILRDPAPDDRDPIPKHLADNHASRENRFAADLTDIEVVTAINRRISTTLLENGLRPSPRAGSEEWTRRVWLTLVGRIPSVDESRESLGRTGAGSRGALINQLLENPERSWRLAEIWTSLMVGRSERLQINRPALQDYLYTAFLENRPWITIVGELISAQGRSDENGATNFLLAHLDNEATPATAVTARLFLGTQLQCVQCHNHPFDTQIKQHEYWAFNAFFQHTDCNVVEEPATTQPAGIRPLRLHDHPAEGMTYFETLLGQQQAVEASYDGQKISASSKVRRRTVLAELLGTDSRSRVSRAMVNRVWADFFGYGFSTPVDDMGPHAAISQPELLADLTDAFVASGYDLRRLQKWIAMSDAWQCTSKATQWNETDVPEAGEMPLFSRVYLRRMAPEELYDSIRVVIRTVSGQPEVPERDSVHRREWVRQTVRSYNTDENDEADEFIGSITQAMVMMNGPDINSAIRRASKILLANLSRSVSGESVLQRVSLAVLTRRPTSGESKVFRQHLRRLSRSGSDQEALLQVTEDMLWAYLNSSEFQLVH